MKIAGGKLSYKLNAAPPTWLRDGAGKFKNCNWYLHHLSQFPNNKKPKTFKNNCLIMMKWAINSKIHQNIMPLCFTAEQGYPWHRSNVSVLLCRSQNIFREKPSKSSKNHTRMQLFEEWDLHLWVKKVE